MQNKNEKTTGKKHRKCQFFHGFGKVLEGVWEGLGRVLGGFWEGFGRRRLLRKFLREFSPSPHGAAVHQKSLPRFPRPARVLRGSHKACRVSRGLRNACRVSHGARLNQAPARARALLSGTDGTDGRTKGTDARTRAHARTRPRARTADRTHRKLARAARDLPEGQARAHVRPSAPRRPADRTEQREAGMQD